ncbi:hypothetical protein SPFL3102_01855 [Sporomusaceae bacterium FL31]|nr:hypothetical protein SPFL3101_03489 [Sporomusaceae bacterium FL31]GCE34046.1 hypothetical protein SPFL3102_01855 [Sporomusaceae bacterium]
MNNFTRKILITSMVAVLITLGGMAWGLIQPAVASAAAKAPASTIGVVDYDWLLDQYPGIDKASAELKAANEQAKQEYESKAAGLSDQEKQQLGNQLGQRVAEKREQLLGAMLAKIDAAVKAVADEKGLTAVVPKSAVVYGGLDINNDVLTKVKKSN